MMYKEYTALWLQEEEKTNPEVFIHINEKGKIIRAYCWADHIPYIVKYTSNWDEKEIKAKTTPSKNSLFVNLSNSFIINNIDKVFICEEFEEVEKDEYLLRAITNYKNLEVIP